MENRMYPNMKKIPEECLEFPDFCTTITKNPKSTREYFKLCYESFQPLEYYLEKHIGNLRLLNSKRVEIPEGYTCDMDYHKEKLWHYTEIQLSNVSFDMGGSTYNSIDDTKKCTCSSFDLFHKGCTCGYMEAP